MTLTTRRVNPRSRPGRLQIFARRGLLSAVLFVSGSILGPAPARAQSATAPELKAALVLNFARFATWPEIAPGAAILVCVFGDDRVADALSLAVRGQAIDGRALKVSKLPTGGSPGACQLLFVGAPDIRQAAALLDSARTLPVLTVSDGARFAQSTGMVELFVDAGRMRFAVNIDAVGRSRLSLSSRLLGLAKIVRDDHVQ
jgi:hypothetical protein